MPKRNKRDSLAPAEQVLLRENDRLRRKLKYRQGVEEIINQRLIELLAEKELVVRTPPRVAAPGGRRTGEECVGLVHVTDTQIGKVTKSYDSNVAHARLMQLAEHTTRYLLVHNAPRGIKELHVYLGGDMVEGEMIFPHQAHLIDSCVLDQATRHAPFIFCGMLLHWLEHFQRVKVFCVSGNHGRPAGKHDTSHPKTNWDRACYRQTEWMMKALMRERRMRAEKLDFLVAENFYLLDEIVPGTRNLLTHGDLIRGGSTGGLPILGAERMVRRWADSIKVRGSWQNLFFGHFHQIFSFPVGSRRVYCGGTTESDNYYALSQLGSQSMPEQVVSIWHPDFGQIDELRVKLKAGLDGKPVEQVFEIREAEG